jgi:hypothetical protein
MSALRAVDTDAAAEATLLHLRSAMQAFDSVRE